MATPLEISTDLPSKASSDLKRIGWRGLLREVARVGQVAVTNHRMPEAVVIDAKVYDQLVKELVMLRRAAQPSLADLEERFAARIAQMRKPEIDTRLRELFTSPIDLEGSVRVGRGN